MSLSIIQYLRTLIPHVEKKNVLEDLRITETELQTTVLKAYSDAASFFAKDKFKSDDNIKIDTRIRSIMKPMILGRLPTFIGEFSERLIRVEKNIGSLIKAVDKEIGRDVVTEGVSSKKIVLIRVAERISYISRYSLDLLNLVYLNEASALGADTKEISMSPAEIAKAKDSVDKLARLILSYGIESKEFESLIDKAPDILLTRTNSDDIAATYTDVEVDPMTSHLVSGFTGNPIYHIRLAIAEWQTKRYKANQAKKKILELRLLHLNILKQKQGTNPRLEQEISYNQSRVARIDRALIEVERDLELIE